MAPIHLLFVCTGNSFRSPMAQAFVARAAREDGLDLTVESAGTLGGDRLVSPHAAVICAQAGADISAHRSSVLTLRAIDRSDLILGMAREHVRAVVTTEPGAWDRSFTLKEFVRRGEMAPPAPEQSLGEWLAAQSTDRQRRDLMGSSDDDDVFDPIAASVEKMRATGAEITSLVGRTLKLLEPYT